MKPLVGVSCNFFHPDPDRNLFKNKRLMYVEQELTRYLHEEGAVPVAIPHTGSLESIDEVVSKLDAVVLGGGSDVSPECYGETSERWPGEPYQDEYELRIINQAAKTQKPILGVCRGCQILNVAWGGTLYQDLNSQGVTERKHRDTKTYDRNHHKVFFEKNSVLEQIYSMSEAVVSSVHHQAVKEVAPGLQVVAKSDDGVVEAVQGKDPNHFVLGVQWHPEWHPRDSHFLDSVPILDAFLGACKKN